jgi:hypothetical protein
MMSSENHELSVEERAAFAALTRELPPSDLLEERVIRALRNEGHLGTVARAPRQWTRQLTRVAAAFALFAGGVATGHYLLLQPESTVGAPTTNQASITKPAPQSSNGAQSVRNNTGTVVAEREMWL